MTRSGILSRRQPALPKPVSRLTRISLKPLDLQAAPTFWQRMRQLLDSGAAVAVSVRAANRGALVVDVLTDPQPQCHGFIPFIKCTPGLVRDDDAKQALIGTQLSARIFEAREDEWRLLLCMPTRQEMKATKQAERHRTSEEDSGSAKGDFELQCFHVYDAVVQRKRPYGLFMDLGHDFQGLLHISQISHELVKELHMDSFQEGDVFKVMVIGKFKPEDRRPISLSTKRLEKAPGDMFRDRALVFEAAEETAAAMREEKARGVHR